ncbi:MAG: hypothetical protein IJW38_01435 [Clostridia bacterium]|nr:hypothetical protein [Clostridia bacterium]
MLLSAETYRDMYLEGKDESSVKEEAVKLRREIARLKYKMESPSYPFETHPFPSEYDQLSACRSYLNEANERLLALGVTPEYSEEELLNRDFSNNADCIRKVSLAIGTYLDHCYELRIYDSEATLCRISGGNKSVEVSLDREKVISSLLTLNMGEWRDSYLPEHYGSSFSEPVRWRLLIEFSNSFAPRFYEGVGVFPYNFDKLKRLLGVED